MVSTKLTEMLQIKYPIIMAPMFLVSNTAMVIRAAKMGITGAIPALNYRTDAAFRAALKTIKENSGAPFGINLITNKSNLKLQQQLQACYDYEVDYIITSLGSPELIINKFANTKTKIFCDVVNASYAKKVEQLGADAIIAVNSEAGGHAGPTSYKELIPELTGACNIPIISAGGIGDGKGIAKMLELGAAGVSMGSIFIASDEANAGMEYKQACVDYGAKDIVLTSKISGSPCTVINTDYVKKIGTQQNWLERTLNKNRRLKKYAKMLTFYKGMKAIEKAAFSATYKTVWCAGPSIEYVSAILPVDTIIENLIQQLEDSYSPANSMVSSN